MPSDIEIRPVSLPFEALADLATEARAEGFGFIDRLVAEWETGANQFSRRGEVLCGAFDQGKLVAIGGLNCDPYQSSDNTGRLRRFYVIPSNRRKCVGRALVDRILATASGVFFKVRLLASNQEAGGFYASWGFRNVHGSDVTHGIELS